MERALAASAAADLPVNTLLERAAHHACLGHRGKAANWIAVACLLHREEAWRALRQRGLLRCSKYDFNPATPLAIALLILEQSTALRLSEGHITYLRSVIELLRFGSAAQSEFNGLLRDLRRQRNFMAQSCLITLDFLFMQDSYPDLDFGITWSIAPWTKEQLAEGLSFVWAIAERHFGITRGVASIWDAEGIIEGAYLRVLQRAAWLREFSEAEILIDAFDYRCSALPGPRSVALAAPSPELEKSIRFGYIGQEMLQANFGTEAREADSLSCRDIGAALHEAARRAGFIETVDTFPRRVRFHVPEHPELFEDIGKSGALKDEFVPFAVAMQSYGLTPTELDEFQVTATLSLGDIMRVQRFAAIVGSYAATELARRRADPQRVINSVSHVYRGDDILVSFLGLVLSPEAAEDFVDLFGWPRRDGAKVVFDIQYRPLVDVEGE
jgi:hypothetical protein